MKMIVGKKYKFKKINYSKNVNLIVLGVFIGLLGGIFGIVGVFIIPIFVLFLGMDIRRATMYSLLTAFFTSFIKLISSMMIIGLSPEIAQGSSIINLEFALTLGALMIPSVFIGAYFGVKAQKKSSDKTINN
jgi:uncharacterized membrane protein YfcA